MNNKNKNDIFSSKEQNLLEVINASYLSIEDIKWLKSKRWFKKFLKIYSKELKKRYKNKPIIKKDIKPVKENIEILDFTRKINVLDEEVIEILDFTKTIDITDVKDVALASTLAKKKVKKERTIWSIIIFLLSFILVLFLVVIINWFLENKKTKDILENIYDVALVEEKEVTTVSDNVSTTKELSLYEKYANMSILEVNFDNLKEINNDTVGWIKVNGTNINYPFVQTIDNEYYLKHTFDKTSNKKGWVFLDYRNNINNLSKNTVLYAHGLMNNYMFGSMRKVLKSSWYNDKSNHIVTIVTSNKNLKWQVFSCYTIEPESYYITTNFNSNNDFMNFINTIKNRSIYDYNVIVSEDDKILTLSSCYDKEKRMVLHAKLITN